MGAVADAVGGALGAVLDPIKSIGSIAESAVREVGHAFESVGREVGKVGQAAVNDPIGTIAKVAAIATQQYWALPLISAADVMAHGGDLGQAALAAGVSYAGSVIAAGVSDYLGPASNAGDVNMAANDAANLTAQGLSSAQVSEVLQQSYNLAPEVANNITAQTILGNTASEITKDITGQLATQSMLANAAGNTVGGATRAALSGGNASDILMGGVTSGTGSLVGQYATNELKDMGANNTVANVIGKATGAATASTVAGKDAKLSFINSLINTTLAESGKQIGSELKSAWNSTNEAATKFNDQLTKSQEDYKTKLTPLETDAKAAQETAATSYDAYKAIKDKFDGIVADYNKAKEAGDTEKANSLADQANALIPSLNDATSKYNSDVATFDTKLATYNTAADEYKTQTDAVAAAKTEYDARNADLQKTTKDFTETALKVADLGDNAKTTFQKLYDNGTKLSDSYDTAKTVSTMSDVAGGSFLRQYDQTNDLNASLDFANKVNSFDKNTQASYAYAVNTGLDDPTALQYAPSLSGMSKEGQQVFLDGIKSGQDPKAAETSAALAEFFKQYQNDQNQQPAYAPTAGVTTQFQPGGTQVMTDVGGGSSTPLVPANTQTGILPNTTFRYNPDTGKFDIPVADTAGGTSDAASIAPVESTGTGGAQFTPEQKAAADLLDQQLADGLITQEEYNVKAKALEASTGTGTSGTGAGSSTTSNILNTPNLSDNTFTGTAPSGGTSGTAPTSPVTTTAPTSTTVGAGPVTGGTAPSTGTVGTAPVGGSSSTGTADTGTGTGTGVGIGTGTGVGIGTGTVGTVGTVGTGGTGGTGGYGYGTGTSSYGNDYTGGIRNLTPGLTQKMDYTLSGMPNIQEATSPVPGFATGSSVTSDPFSTGIGGTSSDGSTSISSSLAPGLTKAQLSYILTGLPGNNLQSHAEGGSIEDHNPTFFSEGGLNSIENRYVKGEGDGTSDSVAAMLANGEFVIPADVVSKLGNGSNEAGASILDQFLKVVRKDANSNGEELPPDSKGPLAYLAEAKQKMRA
jgi:hypothetical protein